MTRIATDAAIPPKKGGVAYMKEIMLRFEPDPNLDRIDVVIRAAARDEEVTALMARLSVPPAGSFTVFDGLGNLRALSPDGIILASVEGKLVHIITGDGSWYTRQTLQSLEDMLDKKQFLRISRYEIVNLNKVRRFEFSRAGVLRVEMEDGYETWASRRFIPAIRERLRR